MVAPPIRGANLVRGLKRGHDGWVSEVFGRGKMTRIAFVHRTLLLFLALALLALTTSGCPKKKTDGGATADVAAPFAVKDSTEGLLLTWIDDKGDFHVEQKVADVPAVARDAVRVVDPTRDEGTHDKVFVADLRIARPDGTYATHSMTRGEFDAIALARRNGHTATLADDAGMRATVPSANPNGNGLELGMGGGGDPNARPAVIIYGAEWCGPCHQAAAYLRKKGVPFIEKDVEADSSAGKEMRAKLAKSGLHGGSIPVLDVRGKILVGFSPSSVDEALGQAM
jgi:glutaredoxin